jgi:hypothetical protein
MLDPVREKCDLHIRAAGIFVMQLELLEVQRLVTLSHNEGPIVAEEPIFATAQTSYPCLNERVLTLDGFPVCRRTKGLASHANGLRGDRGRLHQRIWAENLSQDTCAISGLT